MPRWIRSPASAKRLEGLRSTKTFVVSYPGANRVRIRFRPQPIPSEAEHDLQPASRVFTALCLVRNHANQRHDTRRIRVGELFGGGFQKCGNGSSPIPAEVVWAGAVTEVTKLRTVRKERTAKPLATTTQGLQMQLTGETLPAGQEEDRLVILVKEKLGILNDEAGQFHGRSYAFDECCYFTPALAETSSIGSFSRRLGGSSQMRISTSPPIPSLSPRPNSRVDFRAPSRFVVPPWLGPAHRQLQITKTFGYYWVSYGESSGAAGQGGRRAEAVGRCQCQSKVRG